MSSGLEKKLAGVTQTEQVVVCDVCGERHPLSSNEFIILYGDVMVGLSSPVITGNIDDKGKIIGSVIICTRHEFVNSLVDELYKIASVRIAHKKEDTDEDSKS